MIKLIYLFDLLWKTVCSLDATLSRAGCSAHQHLGVTDTSCNLPAVVSEPVPAPSLEVVFAACWGAWAAPWAHVLHLLQGMELLPERLCDAGWGCSRAEDALSLCQQRKGLCQPLRVPQQPLLVQQGVCSVYNQSSLVWEGFLSPWQRCIQHWGVCSRFIYVSGLQGFLKDYSLFWAFPQQLRNGFFFRWTLIPIVALCSLNYTPVWLCFPRVIKNVVNAAGNSWCVPCCCGVHQAGTVAVCLLSP